MQPPDQRDTANNIDVRIRTIRILWLVLVLSVGMYYVFTALADRPKDHSPNNTLFIALLAIALSTTLLSFPLKSMLLKKATEQQQTGLVQQAYVVALALCEVPALLGLIDFFLTANRYYYSLLIISTCAQLLHFPRREHVINASFKSSETWGALKR
jgi:hypothetical protein